MSSKLSFLVWTWRGKMVLDFFMFSSTQLITSYDLPCLSWLRLDDDWLEWTMGLRDAVNCQAEQKLACKYGLMCYSWYGIEFDELVRTYIS